MSFDEKKNSTAAISGNDNIPPKPARPYTAYHIFFQLERNYILQINNGRNAQDFPQGVDDTANERPEKYRNTIMPKDWFISGKRHKKRKDHKVHGVISFIDLTKTISTNWNCANDEIRTYCKDVAGKQLVRYYEELEKYVDKYGEEALKAQGRKRKSSPKKITLHRPATIHHDSRSAQISGPNPNNAIADASADIDDRKMPGIQFANNDLTDQSQFSSIDPLPLPLFDLTDQPQFSSINQLPLHAMHQAPSQYHSPQNDHASMQNTARPKSRTRIPDQYLLDINPTPFRSNSQAPLHSNQLQNNHEPFQNSDFLLTSRAHRLDNEVQHFIARVFEGQELSSANPSSDSASSNSSVVSESQQVMSSGGTEGSPAESS